MTEAEKERAAIVASLDNVIREEIRDMGDRGVISAREALGSLIATVQIRDAIERGDHHK